MFKSFWGSQEQEAQPHPQEIPTNSWYPPSVLSSSSSSRPATPSSSASNSFNLQRPADRPQSPSHVSPAEAAGIIVLLKDKSPRLHSMVSFLSQFFLVLLPLNYGMIFKLHGYKLHLFFLGTSSSIKSKSPKSNPMTTGFKVKFSIKVSMDELRKLLSDKDAYNQFFLSLDQVKIQNNLRDELRKETLQLARDNLEKEPCIMELRNQCRIIRTTELAAAQEKLNELERQKEETLKFYSPKSLLNRLQEAMNKTDEESEILHRQLLEREIDVGVFVQKYKKLRSTYHRRALTHLAAKMSLSG